MRGVREKQRIPCYGLYMSCRSAFVSQWLRLENWDDSTLSHMIEWNEWIKLCKFPRLRTINILPFVLSFCPLIKVTETYFSHISSVDLTICVSIFFLLFSGCGQVLRASKGQILLESYPLNAHCEWTIHARPGFIIQLR